MLHPDFLLLYVADPLRSSAFYSRLLGVDPVESAPTFVLFVFPGGSKLGLWLRDDVEPRPQVAAGAAEWALAVGDNAEVSRLHDEWKAGGVPMAQDPVDLDFGFTFVALDPDGHRLRVFAPSPR